MMHAHSCNLYTVTAKKLTCIQHAGGDWLQRSQCLLHYQLYSYPVASHSVATEVDIVYGGGGHFQGVGLQVRTFRIISLERGVLSQALLLVSPRYFSAEGVICLY
jgi:hypothetical protein